jgi:hypothetical protein
VFVVVCLFLFFRQKKMADPFTYNPTATATDGVRQRRPKSSVTPDAPTGAEEVVESMETDNHFGINAAIVFHLVGSWLQSIAHTLLLTLAYSPWLGLANFDSADIFCEIFGPVLGYLLTMRYVGGCYGKMSGSWNTFLRSFVVVLFAQIAHFTVFWMEDVISETQAIPAPVASVVNSKYFVSLVSMACIKLFYENVPGFRIENSCLNRCCSCCVDTCTFIFYCMWMSVSVITIIGLFLDSSFSFDNPGTHWQFRFGGGGAGSGGNYDVPSFGGHVSKRTKSLRALNLGTSATMRDIKTAYRTLAKQYHPDKCGNGAASMPKAECEEKFIHVKEGYEYLTKKTRRSGRRL